MVIKYHQRHYLIELKLTKFVFNKFDFHNLNLSNMFSSNFKLTKHEIPLNSNVSRMIKLR